MRKVILVVHGMRKGRLNGDLTQFIAQLFEEEAIDYELAFLESEIADLESVIATQMNAGVHTIDLVPLLLFSASHYYEDIVEKLKTWELMYPQATFHLAEPLGTHPKMKDWVAHQMTRNLASNETGTAVVVLAHGSARYEAPAQALAQITEALSTVQCPCYPCMVYGTYHYEDVLTELAQQWSHLVIIPYFFYDGYLVQRTKQRIASLALPCSVTFTPAMNFHPILKAVILSRLEACKGGVPCTQFS